MANKKENQDFSERNPWYYIPSLYFAEGLPYILVNTFSVAMFKSLGASNSFIGLTSFLYLPWSLKLFWSPYIDGTRTKRSWLLLMQLLIGIVFIILSTIVSIPYFFIFSIILFSIIAFFSATHDIAIDGFYLHSLNQGQQALFTGIRSTFYRVSMIFAGGILVSIAGSVATSSNSLHLGWSISLGIAGLILLLLYFFHKNILPYPVSDSNKANTNTKIPYKAIFKEYFKQDKIITIISFILLYRFGEGLLVKMSQPFLMDTIDKGGLGIGITELGIIYGTFGVLSLLAGGILGGWLIKKYSLRRLIWIMAICMNLPNLLYVYLSIYKPNTSMMINLSFISNIFNTNNTWLFSIYPIIQSCIIIEQFGYGFGFTAFMVFLLYISKGEYKTSHYAISTGIMAIGMTIPGLLSGYIQESYGYIWLFILSFLTTIPGMLLIFILPINEERKQ